MNSSCSSQIYLFPVIEKNALVGVLLFLCSQPPAPVLSPRARKKETLAQLFSYEFSEISKNTIFTGHLRATASEVSKYVINHMIKCDIFKQKIMLKIELC